MRGDAYSAAVKREKTKEEPRGWFLLFLCRGKGNRRRKGGMREAAYRRGSGGCLGEFRASADARVPFPQGKGTKGCRGSARIPCGAPAPGPPSCKRLVSVEPRRGAPDGVPSGSALTAPLKTFRFQRGPVLRGGKSRRGRTCSARSAHLSFSAHKKPPLKGEVPAICGRRGSSSTPHRSRRLCQPP